MKSGFKEIISLMHNGNRLIFVKMGIIYTVILVSISSASILVILSGASAVTCSFWRVFLASLVLISVYLMNRDSSDKRYSIDRKVLSYSIFSGISLAIHFVMWMQSLFLIPVAISTTVVVTYPLISIVTDLFIFKEKMKSTQIISLILGFIGILLFINPRISVSYSIYGVILALLGSFAAAFYFGIGRFIRKDTDLLSYTIITYSAASVALFFYAVIIKENLFFYPLKTYIYFILLALLPMIGGHTLINYLLKYVKTSFATSITLGEPIGSSIMAYFLFNQQLDLPNIVAMTFVLSSLAYSILVDVRSD